VNELTFPDVPICAPPAAERHIGAEMRMISNLIHREFNHMPHSEEDAISGTNGWILGYLAASESENRDVFQRDLEEQFQVRRATVSKIICLMEQKGLIERCPVPQDARLKKLKLTEKGRKTHSEKVAEFERIEKELTAGIPPEKLGVFFEVCDLIKQNIIANNTGNKEANEK
jgi:DNA-binding MarR family transcriptional regulator